MKLVTTNKTVWVASARSSDGELDVTVVGDSEDACIDALMAAVLGDSEDDEEEEEESEGWEQIGPYELPIHSYKEQR